MTESTGLPGAGIPYRTEGSYIVRGRMRGDLYEVETVYPTRAPLPPTCGFCGGLGHVEGDFHDAVAHTTIPLATIRKHIEELRAMSGELRLTLAYSGIRGVERNARADAYDWMRERLERDIEEATR